VTGTANMGFVNYINNGDNSGDLVDYKPASGAGTVKSFEFDSNGAIAPLEEFSDGFFQKW